MTISSTQTSQQNLLNGSTTQWTFNNKIFAASDLVVTLFDLNGTPYPFTQSGTNSFTNSTTGLTYTVSNVDVDTGCYITMSGPGTTGWTLDMRTATPELQETSIKNQGPFSPELHEEFFDRITREMQDLKRLTYQFGIHGPDNESTPWTQLPAPAGRANSALLFDANGLPVPGTLPATGLYTAPFGGAISQLIQSKLADFLTPYDFGAIGDGVTDDYAALNALFNAGSFAVMLPKGQFRSSQALTIPEGVCVQGYGFAPSYPIVGTQIIFDLGVQLCITLGGSSDTNYPACLRGISITRAPGVVPANTVGVVVQNTCGSIVEDVMIARQAIGLFLDADGSAYGITAFINRVFTTVISDAHFVASNWPEARFTTCRAGWNGAQDVPCNTYIRIQGGSSVNPAEGPNTISFQTCHFNLGSGAQATYVWQFLNQPSGNDSTNELFQWSDTYVEDFNGAFIYSDSTWSAINRLYIDNSEINGTGSVPMFALNAATFAGTWLISNTLLGVQFNLGQSKFGAIQVSNCSMVYLATVTANGSVSSGQLESCSFLSGLTLSGALPNCKFSGTLQGGAINTSATTGVPPLIDIAGYNNLNEWTPALTFGGGNTGLNAPSLGFAQIMGNQVFVQGEVSVNAVGSSTGVAQINIPVLDISTGEGGLAAGSGGGLVDYATGMTGITGAILVNVNAGLANFYFMGSSGVTALTNANFTSSSVLRFSFHYVRLN